MLIREATALDAKAIMPLIQQYWAFEDLPGFSESAIEAPLSNLLSDKRLGQGWVALEQDEAVAYLLVVYVFSLEHQGLTAEIDEFFIAEPYRSAGLGHAMLNEAEAAATIAGCSNLSLQVSDQNQPAIRFYRHTGFEDRAGYRLLEKSVGSAHPTSSATAG
ncbi:MAG: N-acetyltransferase family protein [Burkholderiaceae bacterium]